MNPRDAMKRESLNAMTLKLTAVLLMAAAAAQAEPLSIQITKISGEPMPGWLIAADKDGLMISDAPNGGNSIKLPMASIRDMTVDEPKGWSLAQQNYAAGNYSEAEKQFALLGMNSPSSCRCRTATARSPGCISFSACKSWDVMPICRRR
jgi:hypothetical protein